MKYKISENVDFYTGASKEDEENGFVFDAPFPTICIYSKTFSSYVELKDKIQYEIFTNNLFWVLAEQKKIVCPKCGCDLECDSDPGDDSVGMQSYRMAGCTNEKCYFKLDGQTEEIEKELIRTFFPLYWRWDIE